jgi:hypothetical protein
MHFFPAYLRRPEGLVVRRLLSGAGVCSLYLEGFKLSEFNIDSKDLPAWFEESIFAGRRITRPSP